MKNIITTLITIVISYTMLAQTIVYVDQSASGNEDGTSWANAYTDLNTALVNTSVDNIYNGAEIWIAEGVYTRTMSNQLFFVDNNVLLYGGFNGTETDKNQRDIQNHPTIVSGDIMGNDQGIPASNNLTMQENAKHIFFVFSEDRALFDGLIIENAYSTTEAGGGIRVASSTLTNLEISNCTIRNNVALNRAGVFYYAYDESSFFLFNNRIENNVNVSPNSSYTIEFRAAGATYQYSEVHWVNNLFKQNISESPNQSATCGRFTLFAGSDVDLYMTNNTFINNPQNSSDAIVPLIGYEFGSSNCNLNAFLNNNIFYDNPGVTDIFGSINSFNLGFIIYNSESNYNVQDFQDNLNMINTQVISSSPFIDYSNANYAPISTFRSIGNLNLYNNQILLYNYPNQNYPTTDLAGNDRFDNQGNLDLGAYQYKGSLNLNESLNNSENLKIFPNPSNGIYEIELNGTLKTVEVRNLTGQLIYSIHNVNSSIHKLNLVNFPPGQYIANIITDTSTIRKKIVKL